MNIHLTPRELEILKLIAFKYCWFSPKRLRTRIFRYIYGFDLGAICLIMWPNVTNRTKFGKDKCLKSSEQAENQVIMLLGLDS